MSQCPVCGGTELGEAQRACSCTYPVTVEARDVAIDTQAIRALSNEALSNSLRTIERALDSIPQLCDAIDRLRAKRD